MVMSGSTGVMLGIKDASSKGCTVSSQAEAHPFDIKDITPPCEAAVGKNCLFADDCVLFLLMFHR